MLECMRFKKKNSFEQEEWIFTSASKNLQYKIRELNVHDSFLVSLSYVDWLNSSMDRHDNLEEEIECSSDIQICSRSEVNVATSQKKFVFPVQKNVRDQLCYLPRLENWVRRWMFVKFRERIKLQRNSGIIWRTTAILGAPEIKEAIKANWVLGGLVAGFQRNQFSKRHRHRVLISRRL